LSFQCNNIISKKYKKARARPDSRFFPQIKEFFSETEFVP